MTIKWYLCDFAAHFSFPHCYNYIYLQLKHFWKMDWTLCCSYHHVPTARVHSSRSIMKLKNNAKRSIRWIWRILGITKSRQYLMNMNYDFSHRARPYKSLGILSRVFLPWTRSLGWVSSSMPLLITINNNKNDVSK